jgi:hypothetical protein
MLTTTATTTTTGVKPAALTVRYLLESCGVNGVKFCFVLFCSSTECYVAQVETVQGLARVIHGHPIISEFCSLVDFTLANLGPWCSALATLPSLECVTLSLQEPETEGQRVFGKPRVFDEPLSGTCSASPASSTSISPMFYVMPWLMH